MSHHIPDLNRPHQAGIRNSIAGALSNLREALSAQADDHSPAGGEESGQAGNAAPSAAQVSLLEPLVTLLLTTSYFYYYTYLLLTITNYYHCIPL